MNDIYLRRQGKLLVEPGEGGAGSEHLASVLMEAEQLGYVFADSLMARLGSLSIAQLATFRLELLETLRRTVGAHRVHEPLYPGFPTQALRLSVAERYLVAVFHYLTLRRLPAEAPGRRPPLLNGKAPRPIELGTREEFESIATRLAGSRTSLSAQDKADLAWFVQHYGQDVFRLLPEAIPFKENLAVIGAQLLRHAAGDTSEAFVRRHSKTATDVLRLAVALSDGDVSLAVPTRFRSMKRAWRKLLASLVEQTDAPTEDMLRWSERWKRLGEVLHPGEFAERFPKTFAAFAVLRNDSPFRVFNSGIETRLRDGQAEAAALALQARPGNFARRLDHLLRTASDRSAVLQGFSGVAERVSTPVLLQVMTHFSHRGQDALRAFFPKGEVAKVFAIAEARAALPAGLAEQVAALCERTLLGRFALLPPLGPCYLDPDLRNYRVPFSQRSASRSLRTLVRGSRLPMPEAPCVRLFLWWMNGRGRADVDLSAAFFGPGFEFIDTVAYYQLASYGGYHSGDIIDAPQGAAEFIDLDLQRLRERKIRFVVMALNSYTEQPYCDLPECFAGWMARADLNSGEAFEARTVEDRIDVASDTRICLPLALDLEARCVVWMDIALQKQPRWNNVRNNLSGISLMLRAIVSLAKTDLLTLFSLHARARGEIVATPAEAQTVFSVREGITPFDIDRVRAEFL